MNLVTEHAPDGGNAPVEPAPEAPVAPVTPVADADYEAFKAWQREKAAQAAADAAANAPTEFYVWLCNGDVSRVKETDFPVSLTRNGGHFEKDGNSYRVVGVYPVEEKVA